MILITRSMRIFTEMEVGVNKFGLKKIVRPRGKDKYDEATGANLGQVWHDIINFECLIPTNCMLILKERWNLLIETVAKEKERELSTGELGLGRAERRRRSRCGGRRNWPRPTFDAHGTLRGEDAAERPWEPCTCALPRPTLAGAGGEGVASAVQAHRGAGGTCGADTPGPPLPHRKTRLLHPTLWSFARFK